MRLRAFRYLLPFIVYAGAFRSFTTRGWEVWMPLVWAFVFIPLLELFIKPSSANLNAAQEEAVRKDRTYDYLLYVVVLLQYASLYCFCYTMKRDGAELSGWDTAGRIAVMGLLCGVFGINVGHELGHRLSRFEQFLAKALLLTSLYMHFFTEHNKGHHKRVATPEDPSSARYGEPVYLFYFRTVVFSYISAWHIANAETKKKGRPVFSFYNEMIVFTCCQLLLIAGIGWFFGLTVLWCFLAAATMGFLLLESVNYIEHYGLQRRVLGEGKYERALPEHSWNSDHIIGRLMLFELSRHSDHHYMASRKYPLLRHHDHSPQMPTGYPGMILLSLVPPAWFYVMNRRIKKLRSGPMDSEPVN